MLIGAGLLQRKGKQTGYAASVVALVVAALSVWAISQMPVAGPPAVAAADKWSEARVQSELAAGKPVFVYFTADWCLTCKANEAAAIEREAVREAFGKAAVTVLVGDWTNGDPAISRFLESRGRAGVPLYLWYEPGEAEPEELPQILTPGMLVERAARKI
jgi:thiol:disulfide interchange protein